MQKTFDVVIAANVDADECVDNNLVEILKLKFGRDSKPGFWLRYRKF